MEIKTESGKLVPVDELEFDAFVIRSLLNYHERVCSGLEVTAKFSPEFKTAVEYLDGYKHALERCLSLLEKEAERRSRNQTDAEHS